MPYSGGGVSFSSAGLNSYSVSYTAPTFTPPSGATLTSVNITSAGPSSVSCGSSASQTYQATYRFEANVFTYESASVSGTAPACVYPPSWSDNSLGPFVAGQGYSDGVTATNMNYSGSYSVSSGSLPSGLSLNTSTGAITGTVTSAADYSFTITATNSYASISQAFSGTIAGGIRIWNGTAWLKRPVQVWNGTAWVVKTLKVWSGSSWDNSK